MKVRGNAQQVVEKYLTLAREAATAGDPVAAENYYQHAEHYYRIQGAGERGGSQTQTPNGDGRAEADFDDADGRSEQPEIAVRSQPAPAEGPGEPQTT